MVKVMVMVMDPDSHATYAHNGKVMLGSAILLFLIVLIVIFFHTYGHLCFRGRRRHLSPHRLRANSSTAATPSNEGLDPSVLKFLPTFTYSSATHLPLHDCAVCLSEFADYDEGRVLPNCNHAFHSHCIDTWFRSHSNCPLCRAPVHQPAPPVQPPEGSPPTTPSIIEPCSVSEHGGAGAGRMEEGQVGCSSLPAPIGCPKKSLGIIIEVPEEEEERTRGSDPVPGDLKSSDHGILSLKRFWSV